MAIDVATPVYEGPFDLLLQLILAEEVDIYEVSLTRIVDAYLAEIERLQALDLDVATEFLLIAATLVELKARRLLPGRADIDLDDELALWEERDLLLARLLECKTFKDVAAVFSRARRRRRRSRGPPGRSRRALRRRGARPARGRDHRTAARGRAALRSPPSPCPRIDLFHVAPIRVSVADAVAELLDELPRVGRITFRRLTADLVERLDVIVRFLAVLELFKQGVVELDQTERFGDDRHRVVGWRPGRGGDGPGRRRLRWMRRWTTMSDRRATTRHARRRATASSGCAAPSRPSCWSRTIRSHPTCWPSCWSARSPTSSSGATSSPTATRARPRLRARRIAGGYRYQTVADLAPYVERFLLHDQRARLSGAALETLAIVAYKQPISRAQIASIRGVDPDGVIRTLQARGYVDEVGRDNGPGQAILFGTTADVPREARPRLDSTTCRRSPSSSPAPMSSKRSRRLRIDVPPPDAPT